MEDDALPNKDNFISKGTQIRDLLIKDEKIFITLSRLI